MDRERMRHGVRLQVRAQHGQERANGGIVEKTEHIPKQADIEACFGRKLKQFCKLLAQGGTAFLRSDDGQFTKQVDEMQFTAVAGKKVYGIGQCRTHVKNGYRLLLIEMLEQMG